MVAGLGWCFPRVRVTGTSMAPLLAEGDRLLVQRTRRVRRGDVVVVADPRTPRRWVVKRARAVAADGGVEVRGDAPDASTDSRSFGIVPSRFVIGRVRYRYAPSDRAGRVR